MKRALVPGEKKIHTFQVTMEDVASFKQQTVHNVCATFTLAREIEWSTRLFLLDVLDEDEEGVGTQLTIDHKSPAFVEDVVNIEAEIVSFDNNELICNYAAKSGNRVVASGVTGQKVFKKSKISEIFSRFRNNGKG